MCFPCGVIRSYSKASELHASRKCLIHPVTAVAPCCCLNAIPLWCSSILSTLCHIVTFSVQQGWWLENLSNLFCIWYRFTPHPFEHETYTVSLALIMYIFLAGRNWSSWASLLLSNAIKPVCFKSSSYYCLCRPHWCNALDKSSVIFSLFVTGLLGKMQLINLQSEVYFNHFQTKLFLALLVYM